MREKPVVKQGGDWLIAHSDGRGAFYLGDPVPHKEISDA
jgi:hypothetical protein